jgi:hypothetical protein
LKGVKVKIKLHTSLTLEFHCILLNDREKMSNTEANDPSWEITQKFRQKLVT